ncbi:MAG: PilZ domain-containing protein [Nitrospira sp.]|nr:PilZ domain-containing protein [Nitrospira sp.]
MDTNLASVERPLAPIVTDRRTSRRLSADNAVAFTATGARGAMAGHGRLIDVSDSGCQIRSDKALALAPGLAPSSRMELRIAGEADEPTTILHGCVIWSGDRHFGVQFLPGEQHMRLSDPDAPG